MAATEMMMAQRPVWLVSSASKDVNAEVAAVSSGATMGEPIAPWQPEVFTPMQPWRFIRAMMVATMLPFAEIEGMLLRGKRALGETTSTPYIIVEGEEVEEDYVSPSLSIVWPRRAALMLGGGRRLQLWVRRPFVALTDQR